MLQAAEDSFNMCVRCGNLTGRKHLSLCQSCSNADVVKIFPQLAAVGLERLRYQNRCCSFTETAKRLELHDSFRFRLVGIKDEEE
jgi:hypothetical protein